MTPDVAEAPSPIAKPRLTWWPSAVVGIALALALLAVIHRPAGSDALLAAARQWRRGHMPLWDASSDVGKPTLVGGNLAAFSPTVIPLINPARWAWFSRELLRLLLAGIGAGCFARLLRGRNAKIVLSAGGYLLVCALLAQFLDTAADAACWLPWCLLALAWAIGRLTPARFAVVALSFGAAFSGGDVYSSAAVLLIGLAFLAPRAARRHLIGAIVALPLAMLLGFALTAAIWMTQIDGWRRPRGALPFKPPNREWTVYDFRWAPTRAAAQKLVAEPTFDAGKVLILDEQVSADWPNVVSILKDNPPSTRPSKPGFFSSGGGTLTIDLNDQWRTTRPQGGGWLVIAQAYDPGWSARFVQPTLIGHTTRDKAILPADGGLLAIPMHDEGSGTLELTYRPAAWRRGAIVSAAGAVLVLVLFGFSLMGRG